MTPAKGLLVALVAILAAAGASARSVPGPASASPKGVPEPFFVGPANPTTSIYFRDAPSSEYEVVCRTKGGKQVGRVEGPIPNTHDGAVMYFFVAPAHGNYACNFSRKAGARATPVKFAVYPKNTVPPVPFLTGIHARVRETTVVFAAAPRAAAYFATYRPIAGGRWIDATGIATDPTNSTVTVTFGTPEPGKYECVVFAKDSRGRPGEKSYLTFVVKK